MDRDQFNTRLGILESEFNRLEPEVSETLHDPALGVEGYVVVWNTDISVGGPVERMGKGGTRITPKTNLEEIKMLARIMALKNAATGLPLGGAKSGIKADPDMPDFEKHYRRFAGMCKPLLFEHGGVFGGFGFDMGARPEHPLWVCDELGSTRSFTGKPLHMGGTDYDKEGIAGLGVATAAKVAMEYDGKTVEGASFAVQGAGAMGAAIIKYFSQYGGILKSIADPRLGGSWFLKDGASAELIHALAEGDFIASNALLENGAYQRDPDLSEVLYAKVDVLFPAAVQDVIYIENADKIQADYLSEGSNNPSSNEARSRLHENGITVIPDFIANPGGIIAAYVEMTSPISIEKNFKTRAKVEHAKAETIKRITENVRAMMTLVRSLDIEPARAGRFMALQNLIR